MSDCVRIIALMDVYLDDGTSAETNALVQDHLAHCGACARRLELLRAHRTAIRSALGSRPAPAHLQRRVRSLIRTEPRPALAALIRSWVIPAMATALVAWIVMPWRAAEPESYTVMAVAEHRACALNKAVKPRGASYYGPNDQMPLLAGPGSGIRVVDAHACGQQSAYTHVVFEADGGGTGSILISRAAEGAARTVPAERRGEFEVAQVRTARHRAFVVVDRRAPPALRDWRQTTMVRLQRFLKQQEEM